MSEQARKLIAAIRATPEANDLRLIYSDWLEDQGELKRAAFVRWQCGQEKPSNGPVYTKKALREWFLPPLDGGIGMGFRPQTRIVTLSGQMQSKPLEQYGWHLRHPVSFAIERGFIAGASMPLALWLAYGPQLSRDNPIVNLLIKATPVAWNGFAAWDRNAHWRQFTGGPHSVPPCIFKRLTGDGENIEWRKQYTSVAEATRDMGAACLGWADSIRCLECLDYVPESVNEQKRAGRCVACRGYVDGGDAPFRTQVVATKTKAIPIPGTNRTMTIECSVLGEV